MQIVAPLALIALPVAMQASSHPPGPWQPGVNPVPNSPGNISTFPNYWLHGTPLLQGVNTTAPNAVTPSLVPRQTTPFWSGWQDIHYLFAFGDSYTSTNFTLQGEQPGPGNPLGNPPYPGATSCNGPNYIDFLTTTYNQSYIQTYNFGYGGATIDPFLVQSGFGPAVQSFRQQINDEFLPTYVNNSQVPWTSSNSLFSIFFGINDVTNSDTWGNLGNDSLNYDLIKDYESLVNQLYAAGARNFLFLNVPPIDRSPGTLELSSYNQTAEAAFIGAFNFRLGALVYNLAVRHTDTTLFLLDTNYLFTRVLDDPGQFPETAEYRITTSYCTAYENGTQSLTSFDPSCGVPVNEYFWLNTLHPTYPMHNFMSSQIVRLLDVIA